MCVFIGNLGTASYQPVVTDTSTSVLSSSDVGVVGVPEPVRDVATINTERMSNCSKRLVKGVSVNDWLPVLLPATESDSSTLPPPAPINEAAHLTGALATGAETVKDADHTTTATGIAQPHIRQARLAHIWDGCLATSGAHTLASL